MIKIHLTYLYTTTIQKTMIVVVMVTGIIVYTISEYKHPSAILLFFHQQYILDYLVQGLSLIKFLMLIVVVLSWIYATKISRYNVYLCVRFDPTRVFFSQLLVLIGMSLIVLWTLLSLFIVVWLLYPGTLDLSTVLSLFFSSTLWIIQYHMICFLLHVLFDHTFALMIPLMGYLLGMIQVGMITSQQELENSAYYTQILFPDIVYTNDLFRLIFGPFIHLSTVMLLGLTIWKILQKNDFARYL